MSCPYCESECHCCIGEIESVYKQMSEAHEEIWYLQEKIETDPDPKLQEELKAAWEIMYSCEREIGEHINDTRIAEDGIKIYPPRHLARGNRMEYRRLQKHLREILHTVLESNKHILDFKTYKKYTEELQEKYYPAYRIKQDITKILTILGA